MKNKKVVVAVKFFKGELNPFDGAALECALESGASEITVVAMAPVSALNALQALTRLRVKAVLVSDKLYAGADTIATSLVLQKAIERLNPDYVYCGRQSVDGDTAQVPAMLAKRLGYSFVGRITQTDGELVTTRDGKTLCPKEKTVLAFERIRTLRFPSIFSKPAEVEIWDNSLLQIDETKCGQTGSPTRVIKAYESTVGRRECRFIEREALFAQINAALLSETARKNEATQNKTAEVFYAGDIRSRAEAIAERAIPFQTEGKDAETVAEELVEKGAKIVLWEDDPERKTLASEVAVLLGAGLCADCISFREEGGKFVMTRPAQGGNITADIVADSEISMATVRTPRKGKSDLVFCVGKGAMDDIEKIRALAETFGAELCASRFVVDSGKLPYETQVGLTGKTVSPKVYVAFGVSGAVQHTCAIEGAGTVIAVNTDKNARIFDYADFGVIADVQSVINNFKE